MDGDRMGEHFGKFPGTGQPTEMQKHGYTEMEEPAWEIYGIRIFRPLTHGFARFRCDPVRIADGLQ